jgi:hypothetical protein
MKIQPFDQLQNVVLVRGIAQTDLEPFRLWLSRLQVVANYPQFSHLATWQVTSKNSYIQDSNIRIAFITLAPSPSS